MPPYTRNVASDSEHTFPTFVSEEEKAVKNASTALFILAVLELLFGLALFKSTAQELGLTDLSRKGYDKLMLLTFAKAGFTFFLAYRVSQHARDALYLALALILVNIAPSIESAFELAALLIHVTVIFFLIKGAFALGYIRQQTPIERSESQSLSEL